MENKITELNKKLLIEIMNIMIPTNDEIPSAGNMGIYKQLEKYFIKLNSYNKSIITILKSINLHPYVRISGSFFSIDFEKKIEILKWHEENMIDDFNNLKGSIFAIYYNDQRVIKKIDWDQKKNNYKKVKIPNWDQSILEKVNKIEPFWKKI